MIGNDGSAATLQLGRGRVGLRELSAQCRHHRPVVGAEPGRRYPQSQADRVAPFLGQGAQPRVGGDSAADDEVIDAALPGGPHRLDGEHVDHGLLERRRHVRDRHRLAGLLRASTHRATAVFNPEKENANGSSRGPVIPRGKAIAAELPDDASRSIGGPPGNGKPNSRATLS